MIIISPGLSWIISAMNVFVKVILFIYSKYIDDSVSGFILSIRTLIYLIKMEWSRKYEKQFLPQNSKQRYDKFRFA